MNLAIKAENEGLCLRILDVEGEWKKIIPQLTKETVYYDSEYNLKVNPFDLKFWLNSTNLEGNDFHGYGARV